MLPNAALFWPWPVCETRDVEPLEYQLMDAVEDGMWWYRALHARVLDAVSTLGGQPRGRLLDAGCGTGGFLARLRQRWPDAAAEGLEYNPEAAARAAAKSGWPVATGSVLEMPYPDAAFATVTSMDVLCHAAVEPAAALAEMHRVLAPGGRLVLNLPAFMWLHSAHDIRVHNARRFTAPQVRALLAAAGFASVKTRYWNALLLPLMVLQRKIMAAAPEDRSDVAAFPPWQNATLLAVTELERHCARLGLPFPAGGSVLAVATRP